MVSRTLKCTLCDSYLGNLPKTPPASYYYKMIFLSSFVILLRMILSSKFIQTKRKVRISYVSGVRSIERKIIINRSLILSFLLSTKPASATITSQFEQILVKRNQLNSFGTKSTFISMNSK